MAAHALESRFERMSVNDENDPGEGKKYMAKVNKFGLKIQIRRS